jgi:hypothetical protein
MLRVPLSMPPHRRVAIIRLLSPLRCWVTGRASLPSGRLQSALEGGFLCLLERSKILVPEPNANQIREALEFSRFRFKLIEFLKLQFDIGEPALRKVLERNCRGVYRNYLARAERVAEILKSEDTEDIEDTLEMNVRVLQVMDHRRSDSPNG